MFQTEKTQNTCHYDALHHNCDYQHFEEQSPTSNYF